MTVIDESLGPLASITRHIVRDSIAKTLTSLNSEGSLSDIPELEGLKPPSDGVFKPHELPQRPDWHSADLPPNAKVCIVGAGMAGLYSALILDHLNIPYDILEAADRPGGRVLTHYFSTNRHDYYDAGAMRFPNVPPMKRIYDLFKRTKVPLIDYHLSGPNCPARFNGITLFSKEGEPEDKDPFRVSKKHGGSVPDDQMMTLGSGMKTALNPLGNALKKGDADSFRQFDELDGLTVRDYLAQKMKLDPYTIQWLEESESATGQFDASFTETVMASIAFDYGEKTQEEWKSVKGGTTILTEALVDQIKTKPLYNKRVTRMALDSSAQKSNEKMVVVANYDEAPKRYNAIINTTTLGCLQRVDMTGLSLSSTVKNAIHNIRYDSATKVAIKFDNPWWISNLGISGAGVAYTDLPIRVCVYPSYNVGDAQDKPAVLLCTYTWSEDATRIGSLLTCDSPQGEDELKDLMLSNLARLHSTDKNYDEIYAMINRSYTTHHGFDWAKNEFSLGSWAFYGPGQFRSLHPHLIRPAADSCFHIVGEAASVCRFLHSHCRTHVPRPTLTEIQANRAWVVGSLESAYRGVWNFLEANRCYQKQEEMEKEFGTVPDYETGRNGYAHILVALGRLKPQTLGSERSGGEDGGVISC